MEATEQKKGALLSKEEQLTSAGDMADWFVPYLYGVEIEAGEISLLVKARITEIVGSHETARQLELLKQVVGELPAEHKNNAVLYCVGYPQDALSVLGDGDIDVTTGLLINLGMPHRPVVQETRVKVMPEDAVPAPLPQVVTTVAQPNKTGREHDYRAPLIEAGVTTEQIRDRLNAYTADKAANNRATVARSAIRFVKWFESNDGVALFARTEGLNPVGLHATIKRLSAVALSEAYDGIDHGMGDLLSDALLVEPKKEPVAKRTPEVKQPVKSGMGEVRKTTRRPESPYDPTPGDLDDDSELAWQSDALCAQTDPEAFFPEKGGSTRDAKKICATCDVKEECLDYALENDQRFGIWGGLSERERRKLRKQAATA